jgi:adenosine deaminase CECR1
MNIEQKADKLRREYLAHDVDRLVFNDFQKALPALRQTALYDIFRRMPKGRLMHAHIEATFDLRYMLSLALSCPDVYVFTSPETPEFRNMQLAHKAWFEGDIPAGWENLRVAVAAQPELKEKIFVMCTSDKENIDENIWPKFEAIFDRFKAVNNYKPFFVALYTEVMMRMAEEGLMGVDFRYISQTIFDEDGRRLSPEEYIDTVKEIETKVRERYPWFTVRLIYCYYKGVPVESVPERLEFARRMIEKYPDVILGFDMVGDEDCGKDLKYYAPVLREAQVPVIMHAGESVNPDNHNVEYALELGIKRIGHGMNLYRYPEVEKKVKDAGVMLEVCPLSNQLLGYVPDLSQHPAAGYIKRGLNVTISSDDCAIFDTAFITDDLLLAYICWDLSLADIKRCLKNSQQGDPQLLSIFEEQWKAFEEAI